MARSAARKEKIMTDLSDSPTCPRNSDGTVNWNNCGEAMLLSMSEDEDGVCGNNLLLMCWMMYYIGRYDEENDIPSTALSTVCFLH